MTYFTIFPRFIVVSLVFAFSFFAANSLMAQTSAGACQSPGSVHIEYHFPMDGSNYVPTHSIIIIRPNVAVDPSAMMSMLKVTGSSSGIHTGSIVRSDDNRTLVFEPNAPFALGEKVTVGVQNSSQNTEGVTVQPISFSFTVSPSEPATPDAGGSPFLGYSSQPGPLHLETGGLADTLPGFQVTADNNPTAGDLFMTIFDFFGTDGFRLILDSLAQPVYVQQPANALDWDFKVLPNGKLAFCEGGYIGSYLVGAATKYYIMDSNFVITDSFATQSVSPYVSDFHDIEILPNGHALMLGQTAFPKDMSKYVDGGKTNAVFVANVIEEVDNTIQQPVWIWRTWDPGHYLDTDATNDPFTGDTIDAVHANAVMQDTDGNILLSSRMLDEITKINRDDIAGSLIWRLGGKHNQFKFINDSIRFSHQHALRRIANGDITLFDNGNYGHNIKRPDTLIFIDSSQIPPVIDTSISIINTKYSRACEYKLDINPIQDSATLVWHYDHDSSIQSTAMGYVQRFDNGNTLINWGLNFGPGTGLSDQPAVTEVRQDGTVAYELHINSPYLVYRAEKFPWYKIQSAVAGSTSVTNGMVLGEPFPNPSNGTSRVVFASPPAEPVQLELYDDLGRMVRSYFEGPAGSPIVPLELETSGLADGTYRLVLRGSSGIASRQLIVLQ